MYFHFCVIDGFDFCTCFLGFWGLKNVFLGVRVNYYTFFVFIIS
jgi:hypothetical protein